MSQYPGLHNGLSKIPVKYLKENLLPKLLAKDKCLLFNGSIFINKDIYKDKSLDRY